MIFGPQNTQNTRNLVRRREPQHILSTLCVPCNLWLKNSRRIGPQNTQSAQNASECGLGKIYKLFGDDLDALIEELNGELTA